MSAAVHLLALDLAKWDQHPADVLCVGVFEDERPLRGSAGLLDWRLAGRLSRLIKAGRFSGASGESLLLPPPGARLPFKRLLLIGLGKSAEFGEARYRAEVRRMTEVLAGLAVARWVVEPPGRATGLIAPRRALELWLAETRGKATGEVTLIESIGGQREMADVLRTAR